VDLYNKRFIAFKQLEEEAEEAQVPLPVDIVEAWEDYMDFLEDYIKDIIKPQTNIRRALKENVVAWEEDKLSALLKLAEKPDEHNAFSKLISKYEYQEEDDEEKVEYKYKDIEDKDIDKDKNKADYLDVYGDFYENKEFKDNIKLSDSKVDLEILNFYHAMLKQVYDQTVSKHLGDFFDEDFSFARRAPNKLFYNNYNKNKDFFLYDSFLNKGSRHIRDSSFFFNKETFKFAPKDYKKSFSSFNINRDPSFFKDILNIYHFQEQALNLNHSKFLQVYYKEFDFLNFNFDFLFDRHFSFILFSRSFIKNNNTSCFFDGSFFQCFFYVYRFFSSEFAKSFSFNNNFSNENSISFYKEPLWTFEFVGSNYLNNNISDTRTWKLREPNFYTQMPVKDNYDFFTDAELKQKQKDKEKAETPTAYRIYFTMGVYPFRLFYF
jgi:hypothetical protein